MKKLLLTLLLLCGSAGTFAQSKLNPAARFMIHQAKSHQSRGSDVCVSAIVKLNPGEDISAIRGEDVTVLSHLGQFAVVSMPLAKAEEIASDPAVQAVSFGQQAQPMLDKARPASCVDILQDGISNGFPENYTGNGVLLGMMDQGLDPNHINFYNKDLTENRILGLITIMGENSTKTDYNTPRKIINFSTDNSSSTHATHVAGIMGGSYNSAGKCPVTNAEGNIVVSNNGKIPYYGVATQARLYPCVGSLYDANIVLGAQLFAAKAKELGMPGVFNLSVGYVPGPHDGSDLINQALAEVGKQVVICVAAGNDGYMDLSLQNDFSVSPEIKTILTQSSDKTWYGEVDTWSDNSSRFSMAFAMIDKNTGAVLAKVDIPDDIPDGKMFYLTNENASGATHDPTFSASFTSNSYIQAVSEVSKNNNRFNLNLMFSLKANDNSKAVPALIYTGSTGTKINSYTGSGMTFTAYLNGMKIPGYVSGNSGQSINNMACGDNVIAVGAYLSRNEWPVLSGGTYYYPKYQDVEIGSVADFTSYGTLLNGRTLPDLCAPGIGVVSSYSRYYAEDEGLKDEDLAAQVTTKVNTPSNTNRINPYGIEAGTSMATPYVSGTVALMLEANPSLKVKDVKSILTSTAIPQNQTGANAIRWGAGRLNADEAMREVLSRPVEIGNINADTNRRFAVSFTPSGIRAIVAGESSLKAKLFSLGGLCVATAEGRGGSVDISTVSLAKGVYVLTVITSQGVKVSKTILIN